ncbi:hypothetical protein R1T08_01895 [Streptomyces sp. SBC-4]|nr:hypothetical protein [Streptomyces sp. SBC-4]MDV5143102.1 hypothetical protein [Streptomyces sp. SBC-4]
MRFAGIRYFGWWVRVALRWGLFVGGRSRSIGVAALHPLLLPDGLDYAAAAPVLCADYTSWSALRAAETRPHEQVAVLGIGGLGHMAVQFSRVCGFETAAVTASSDKHELTRELGARTAVADGAGLREAGGADVILVTGIHAQQSGISDRGPGHRRARCGAVTPVYQVFPKEDIAEAVGRTAVGEVTFRAVVAY